MTRTRKPAAAPTPRPPPRVSTTVIDPLDLAVTVGMMDDQRGKLVQHMRDAAKELAEAADRVERAGLDAEPGEFFFRADELFKLAQEFAAVNEQRRTLRFALGLSSMEHHRARLEEHQQVQAAAKLFPVSIYRKSAPKPNEEKTP